MFVDFEVVYFDLLVFFMCDGGVCVFVDEVVGIRFVKNEFVIDFVRYFIFRRRAV